MHSRLQWQSKDNANELSRIGVNSARSFEQTSRDIAGRLGSRADTSSTLQGL